MGRAGTRPPLSFRLPSARLRAGDERVKVLEFNEDVHLAVRTGAAPQHGAEQRETADAVAPAEGRERFAVHDEILR